jgi:excisionase family DNA binding protein
MATATRRTSASVRPEPLASPAEVAKVLGIPEKTLAQWRSQDKGPEYSKVGRHVRYDWADVNAWLAEQHVGAA